MFDFLFTKMPTEKEKKEEEKRLKEAKIKQEKDEAEARIKQEKEEAEAKIKQEAEEIRKNAIISKTYNLKEYDKEAYDSILRVICQKIKGQINYSSLREFNSFETFDAHYKVYIGPFDQNYEISGKNDYNIKDILKEVRIPQLVIGGYKVITEAAFENISVKAIGGVTTIKVKKGETFFEKDAPDDIIIDKLKKEIKTQLQGAVRGRYIVEYKYSLIMGSENLYVEIDKK